MPYNAAPVAGMAFPSAVYQNRSVMLDGSPVWPTIDGQPGHVMAFDDCYIHEVETPCSTKSTQLEIDLLQRVSSGLWPRLDPWFGSVCGGGWEAAGKDCHGCHGGVGVSVWGSLHCLGTVNRCCASSVARRNCYGHRSEWQARDFSPPPQMVALLVAL